MHRGLTGSGAGPGGRQNNAGPTDTHARLPASRARNAGTPAGGDTWVFGVLAGPITSEQRGVARPRGAARDIGAYEVVGCGDATTGLGEPCDDGNQIHADCRCSSACQLDASGTPCSDGSAVFRPVPPAGGPFYPRARGHARA